MSEADLRLVLVTVPDEATAESISKSLVTEQLAACASRLSGLRSVYRWDGALHDDAEVLLLVKTAADRLEALFARIAELHPYRVPEIVAIPPAYVFPAYAEWVVSSTRPGSAR